ncbi:MAG: transposase [Planctomycetes bacterium]|nr:transposase [Planctomycetota bacterium]
MRILSSSSRIESLYVDVFLQLHAQPPKRIVLHLDATDDPVHGDQLGKFFHGYYRCYCYLPLYIFCGDHLLCARLRPADIDGAAGSVKLLKIGASVRVTVRRVWLSMAESCPYQALFATVYDNLQRWLPLLAPG